MFFRMLAGTPTIGVQNKLPVIRPSVIGRSAGQCLSDLSAFPGSWTRHKSKLMAGPSWQLADLEFRSVRVSSGAPATFSAVNNSAPSGLHCTSRYSIPGVHQHRDLSRQLVRPTCLERELGDSRYHLWEFTRCGRYTPVPKQVRSKVEVIWAQIRQQKRALNLPPTIALTKNQRVDVTSNTVQRSLSFGDRNFRPLGCASLCHCVFTPEAGSNRKGVNIE